MPESDVTVTVYDCDPACCGVLNSQTEVEVEFLSTKTQSDAAWQLATRFGSDFRTLQSVINYSGFTSNNVLRLFSFNSLNDKFQNH